MEGKIIIKEAIENLDVDSLRNELDTESCGAIVSFIGITRGMEGDDEVIRLEFDAWQEKLGATLHSLAADAIKKFSIHSVAMAHRIGSVGPGENIVAIHVASPHRKEAFESCSWLIDELKQQAPLWKKEVRASGTEWKAGLG